MDQVKQNEMQVERAITNPTTSPMSVITLEELRNRRIVTTPLDVPLYSTLRGRARRVGQINHEWNEATLSASFTASKYSNGTISGLTGGASTPTRKNNHVMQVGAIAKVSGIVGATTVTGDNGGGAMEIELNDKYNHLVRSIEYFLWNGVYATAQDEMDGIATLVTTAVDNSAGGGSPVVLDINSVDLAIAQMADAGLTPTALYCDYIVAQRISKFASDRVTYQNTTEAMNGVGSRAFMYASPFGFTVQVKPIRSTFLPADSAYLLDETKINLVYMGDAVEMSEPLAKTDDGDSVLLKSYVGLEVINASAHRVLTNVDNVLA